MRNCFRLLVALLCVALLPLQNFAQSSQEKKEKIQASYMLAFGRQPDNGELNYWLSQPDKSVSQHLQNHRQYASSERSFKKSLIIKSYKDALGRTPSENEIKYWIDGTDLYIDLAQKHVQYLSTASAEYEAVIKRSYQFVLNRQPSSAEISYWKSQGTFSYMILVGCHEQWKKANGQAQKTSGSNTIAPSPSLVVIPVSNKIANETKAAINMNSGNVIAAGSGNVVAAGSGNVVAAGGLN